jgi:signal transduction histidine kinase/DNA-binding response OmpR family regulator
MAGQVGKTRRTVWVVDDSPVDAERARRLLVEDHHVEVFHDGSEMLERLESGKLPDLVVLDWVMPHVTGIEVCRFLRKERASTLQILLLTAQHETEQIVEGLAAGANDFVSKPYADAELRARVKALVRTAELMERLKSAEDQVNELLASSPDALLSVDGDERVTFANEQATRIFNREASAFVGLPLKVLVPGLEHVADDSSKQHLPDVKIGDRMFAPTIRLRPRGQSVRAALAFRDVTERRMADERRLDFYSIVTHDLRSPLGAILLRTEMILSGRRGVLSGELLNDVRRIESAIRSMVALINDFLDLARLEGTSYELARDEIDLADVVRETTEELQPLVDASKMVLSCELAAQGATVVGERRRLQQVLSNLLGNAIKFTGEGGRITVRVAERQGYVETSVTDNGPGIAPEALPTLFDRYTRALDARHHVSGTGLGLMIVREVVEAHGGTVGVNSAKGEGSTFWFRLPRRVSAPPKP